VNPLAHPLNQARRAMRADMREALASMDPALRAAHSAQICAHLTALIPAHSHVAATCPLEDEPDLVPWLDAHMRGPGSLWLPRILGPGEMSFARVTDRAALVPNRHHILEPPADAGLMRLPPISIALVPGLAFGPALDRMGQGGGFYDRWLAAMRAHDAAFLAYGVCFALQQLDAPLPTLPHDQPVDRLITERGLAG
jgi:5-formyltetrahydrofolate cyclo-ligase